MNEREINLINSLSEQDCEELILFYDKLINSLEGEEL